MCIRDRYCYARGHAYAHIFAKQEQSASPLLLSQVAYNAAHCKFVAAQLLGSSEACEEAHGHAADMMHVQAAHQYNAYTQPGATSGIGSACALEQSAIEHANLAHVSTHKYQQTYQTYMTCNSAGACEPLELCRNHIPRFKLTNLRSK